MTHTWDIHGTYMGHPWDIHGTSIGHPQVKHDSDMAGTFNFFSEIRFDL
jgi:hypothetical protein